MDEIWTIGLVVGACSAALGYFLERRRDAQLHAELMQIRSEHAELRERLVRVETLCDSGGEEPE
ncbi:MAG: hypothetical protein VYA51_12975 [Planctomycetota bacterium]|nr:hypothetical protein [Planctomycetota bacterium]